MRSLLVLSALALLGLLAAPGMAEAATACVPSAPLNGAFCAGELCATIGATTYDHDGSTPIACAYDPVFNRNIWKPMSAGVGLVGSGSYTSYGTTNCATGYYAAYTGTTLYPHVDASGVSHAMGSVFCSSVSPPAGGGKGAFSDTTNEGKVIIPCAVCVK